MLNLYSEHTGSIQGYSHLCRNTILQYKMQNTILFQLPKHFENKIMHFISKRNTILYFDRKNRKIKYKIHYLFQIVRCISFSEREIHLYFKNNSLENYFIFCRGYTTFPFYVKIEIKMSSLIVLIQRKQPPQMFERCNFLILLQYFEFHLDFFMCKC